MYEIQGTKIVIFWRKSYTLHMAPKWNYLSKEKNTIQRLQRESERERLFVDVMVEKHKKQIRNNNYIFLFVS